MAEAVKIFLKQVIMTDSIPFEIKKPKYNKETLEAIEEAKKIRYLSYKLIANLVLYDSSYKPFTFRF